MKSLPMTIRAQQLRYFILIFSCLLIVGLSTPLSIWNTLNLRFCRSCLKGQWAFPGLSSVSMHFLRKSASFNLHSEAWNYMLPSGGHLIRQGHSDGSVSVQTVAVFHQLYCLNVVRDYRMTANHTPIVSHCLNYLRESVECQMDLRLEQIPNKPLIAGFERECLDWEAVWKEAEGNYERYQEYIHR